MVSRLRCFLSHICVLYLFHFVYYFTFTFFVLATGSKHGKRWRRMREPTRFIYMCRCKLLNTFTSTYALDWCHFIYAQKKFPNANSANTHTHPVNICDLWFCNSGVYKIIYFSICLFIEVAQMVEVCVFLAMCMFV